MLGVKKKEDFVVWGFFPPKEWRGGWRLMRVGNACIAESTRNNEAIPPCLSHPVSESWFPPKARQFLLPIANPRENGLFQLPPRAPRRACRTVLPNPAHSQRGGRHLPAGFTCLEYPFMAILQLFLPKSSLCWYRNRHQQPAHKDESQLHPFSPSLPKLADLEC